MGMDCNRSNMPLCESPKRRKAVYEMPDAIVISRIPGSR
jgi:hypothetical protein